MTPRTRTFGGSLREVAAPVLRAEGFAFDRSRTFRRIDAQHGFVDIINFQLGQRSLAGKFTVNLGVFGRGDADGISLEKALPYHCPYGANTRLGLLIPAGIPVLRRLPAVGFLLGPRDRWWRCTDDEAFTRRQVRKVTDVIVTRGLPWLEGRVPPQPDA